MGLVLTLTYDCRADLRAHLLKNASEGAFYVPLAEIPDGVKQYDPVTLDMRAEDARCSVQAEVLQVLPGNGIAVQLTDLGDASMLAASVAGADSPRLPTVEVAALARRPARAATSVPTSDPASAPSRDPDPESLLDLDLDLDLAPVPDPVAESEPDPDPREVGSDDGAPRGSSPVSWSIERLQSRWDNLTQAEKVRVARYGKRPARMLVLRGPDKSLHNHILNNPHVSADEIANMASMPTLDPAVLRRIATSSDWQRNAAVAKALVCNPKLPLPLITRLIPRVPRDELSRLARTGKVRASVKEAMVKYLDRFR